MRDIREDLKERLDAIAGDRVQLEEKLKALQSVEAGLKIALREEELRLANLPILLPVNRPNGTIAGLSVSGSLTDIILDTLSKKERPLGLDEIKEEVSQVYEFGERAPGRAIHFGLVGLSKGGGVTRLADGRWTVRSPAQERTH